MSHVPATPFTTNPTVAQPEALLNRSAWSMRWRDRRQSVTLAQQVCNHSPQEAPLVDAATGAALRTLAWHGKWTGRTHEAVALAQKAEGHLLDSAFAAERIDVQCILAVLFINQEKPNLARHCLETASPDLDAQTPSDTKACLMAAQAMLLYCENARTAALTLLYDALACSKGPEGARIQTYIANALYYASKPDAALLAAQCAQADAEDQENEVIKPYIQSVLGRVWTQLGQLDLAENALRIGATQAEAEGDQRALCQLMLAQALLFLKRGKNGPALRRLKAGKRLADRLNYPQWQIQFLRLMGSEYERLGEDRAAMQSYKEILRLKGHLSP